LYINSEMENDKNKESQPLAKPFSLRMKTTQVKKEVVKTNILAGNGFIEVEEEEIHSQKRSVAYLEDGVVKDNDDFPVRKKEKKEYLIPMKKIGNDWRIERLKKIVEEGSGTDEDKARLALMLDAIGGEGGDEEAEKAKNEGAINFNGLGSEALEEAADADYEKIPIGEFGLAFLRGCGWREQDGIGSTNRKAVKLRVSEPRPKGLGLGATISQSGKQSKDQMNGKRKELEKNTRVKIVSGADRGTCGQVKSMDEDNSSCFVELDSNRRIVRVSQYALEVLDKKM